MLSPLSSSLCPLGSSPYLLLPPTNLVATPGDSSVALTWGAVANAATYTVMRATFPGAETSFHAGVVGTAYTDSTPVNGVTYCYTIIAVSSGGTTSGPSNEASATASGSYYVLDHFTDANSVDLTAHSMDKGRGWLGSAGTIQVQSNKALGIGSADFYLTDSGVSDGTITCSVTAGNGAAVVFRASDLHSYWMAKLATNSFTLFLFINDVNVVFLTSTVSAGSSAHTITVVLSGDSISAQYDSATPITTSDNRQSAATMIGFSSQVNGQFDDLTLATGAASAPSGLTATAHDGSITLAWSAQAGCRFNVYQGSSSGAEGTVPIATNLVGTSYQVLNLANGSTYFFKLRAVAGQGESSSSAEVSATPVAGTYTTHWRKWNSNADPRVLLKNDCNAVYEPRPWILADGSWRMAYSHFYSTGNATINVTSSQDGINWQGQGIVAIGNHVGGEASTFLSRPGIYVEGSTTYLTYSDLTGSKINLASSADNGLTWTRIATDLVSATTPANTLIIKDGSTYVLCYDWYNGSHWRCGLATATSVSGPYTIQVADFTSLGNVDVSRLHLIKDGSGLWHGIFHKSPNALTAVDSAIYHVTSSSYLTDTWAYKFSGSAFLGITEAPGSSYWTGMPVDQDADPVIVDCGSTVRCYFDCDYNGSPYLAEICLAWYPGTIAQMLADTTI